MSRIEALIASLATTPLVPGLAALAGFGLMIGLVLWLRSWSRGPGAAADPLDALALLRAGPAPVPAGRDLSEDLARVRLDLRPLLDREEIRLVPFLERAVRDFGRGHRLALQVPAALLIHPRHGSASTERCQRIAAALGERRLTFAVLDRQSRLTAALFLGAGPEPALADTLRLAGAPVIVLDQNWTPEQLKARLRDAFSTEAATEAEPLLAAFTGRKPGR